MTDGEAAFRQAAREAIREALAVPPRFLDPLPLRVRLRLWLHRRVGDAAYWLVCRNHCTAASRLWQFFRMW